MGDSYRGIASAMPKILQTNAPSGAGHRRPTIEAVRTHDVHLPYAPVAQLDRAAASGAVGREFESLRVRQFIDTPGEGTEQISPPRYTHPLFRTALSPSSMFQPSRSQPSVSQQDDRFRREVAALHADAYFAGFIREFGRQFHRRPYRLAIYRLDQIARLQRRHFGHASR